MTVGEACRLLRSAEHDDAEVIARDSYAPSIIAEVVYRWRDYDVPFIPFDPAWEVSVIPPFSADARFRVRRRDGKGETASVYLDFHQRLGLYGFNREQSNPYWEVYPVGNDVGRCAMTDVDRLVQLIRASVDGTPVPDDDEVPNCPA